MAHTHTQIAAPTPMPEVADFFFSACAFLDANSNAAWDETDTPIAEAQFGLSMDGGQTFALGDLTGSDGCASVWAPGGNIAVPFTIRIKPPEGSGLIPIGQSEVVYEGGPHLKFLFREE